jgi:hypothetical protein
VLALMVQAQVRQAAASQRMIMWLTPTSKKLSATQNDRCVVNRIRPERFLAFRACCLVSLTELRAWQSATFTKSLALPKTHQMTS